MDEELRQQRVEAGDGEAERGESQSAEQERRGALRFQPHFEALVASLGRDGRKVGVEALEGLTYLRGEVGGGTFGADYQAG